MDQVRLVTLPAAPWHKAKFLQAGYITVKDAENDNIDNISSATGLSKPEIEAVLVDIERYTRENAWKLETGSELLDKERETPRILTFCEKLDKCLGGGVPCGSITEICGVPGVGKTQLCIQLACDVQIPSIFGGLDGEAIYVDTKGGFVVERVRDVAMATVQHCQYICGAEEDKELLDAVSTLTIEKLLGGIHVYKCSDHQQLLALVNLIPSFLKQHRKVRLLIIDNVAFHFRLDFEDLSLRTRTLTGLAQALLQIAHEFNIAVVLTNQMTTKILGGDRGSYLVPALGDTWGHACTSRLILHLKGAARSAQLVKSPSQKPVTVPFQITAAGIRDIVQTESHIPSIVNYGAPELEEPSAKRQRLS